MNIGWSRWKVDRSERQQGFIWMVGGDWRARAIKDGWHRVFGSSDYWDCQLTTSVCTPPWFFFPLFFLVSLLCPWILPPLFIKGLLSFCFWEGMTKLFPWTTEFIMLGIVPCTYFHEMAPLGLCVVLSWSNDLHHNQNSTYSH